MRQRAVPCWGLCAHPQPQTGADVETALASKSASVREPRHGYTRFGSHDARFKRKRFAAGGLAAGTEIEPHCPRRSRVASTSGNRRAGARRQRAHP
jgi:hypothetical protein